jgi:PTS system mannose-specific IIB component
LTKDFNIALVRVDCRLVHGQILEAWVPFIQAGYIIVVDDKVASDSFFETVIRMAVPSDIEVIVSSVEEFAQNFKFSHSGSRKAMVLFSNVADAYRAFQKGFRFDRLNIGNIYNNECKVCCAPSVLLCEDDIKYLEDLARQPGVFVELQSIPKARPVNIKEALKDYWKTKT